ncbi:unnamed protein product [Urochloa decumbens]|uniref:Protein kinase domain-containing protein n=1 Tax=Urochloa decumbens TaxID=240449 RepID=A0ABC8XDH7_9POAL
MGWTTKAVFRWLRLCCSSSNESSAADLPARGGGILVVGGADAPELTVREVNEATARFSGARLVGEGDHARVYRASLRTGRAAAAKRLRLVHRDSDDLIASTRRQMSAAASRLRHRNVARLLGYTVAADLRVLLYEFADLGTLHDALHVHGDRPPLSWAQRVRVALDAARGLAYLHAASAGAAAHGDFRSSKVLLFPGFRAKVADGHKVFRRQTDQEELGYAQVRRASTVAHMPPEWFSMVHMTPKSDVFSFGVVLLELLTGAKPFDFDATDRGGCGNLWSWAAPLLAEGRVEECIDPKLGGQYPRAGALELATIAVQCLKENPTSRPSMDTVARLINCDVIFRDQHGCRLL